MQDEVIVRLVEEGDAEDLWENVFSLNTLSEVKERIAGNLRAYAAEERIPLVAEVEGHVIATTLVKFDPHPFRAHLCSLWDVVVNPAFQRRGICRRLIEEGKKRAAGKGKSMMLVSAWVSDSAGSTAATVYRRLGFIKYGRLPGGIIREEGAFDEVMFYMPLTDGEKPPPA